MSDPGYQYHFPGSERSDFAAGAASTSLNEFNAEYSLSSDSPLKSIDWGTKLSDTNVTVYFVPFGYSAAGVTSEGWNAYEISQVMLAFSEIEAVTQLKFTQTNSGVGADFVLVNDRDEISTLGFFLPPGEIDAGVGVFGADDWDRFPGGDLEQGGSGNVTITHEVLHGLGLAHPHDGGGTSTIMTGVTNAYLDTGTYLLNQGIYTTMTYNNGYIEGPVGSPGDFFYYWGYEIGPMPLDIAVLQQKYGANTNNNLGDDVYTLPDYNVIGTGWRAIWDNGGTDLIRYTGNRDAVIDLRAATLENEIGGGGFPSAAEDIAGGFLIANGVVVENAEGGYGNDSITGNDSENRITGNDGNDTVDAGRGADTVIAGAGHDLVWGYGDNDSLKGGGGNDTMRGGLGNDLIEGGDDDDRLYGQRNGDTVNGGTGDDTVNGGGGADDLSGGRGHDFVRGGTYADMMQGDNGNDTLVSNRHDDTLSGGAGKDILNAGGDDDRLTGGTGNDWMKGGGGSDVFVFASGHGRDTIDDFEVGSDTLEIDSALANGLSAQGIQNAATVTSEGVLIELSGTDSVLLEGLTSTAGLSGDIVIV